MAALVKLVEQYIAAWNRCDATSLFGMFTDDFVYQNCTTGEQLIGQSFKQFIKDTFAYCEGYSYKVNSEITYSTSGAAWQFVVSGYESGVKFNIYGSEFVEFRGDKICVSKEYQGLDTCASVTLPAPSNIIRTKYQRTGLNSQLAKLYAEKLHQRMEVDKLYRLSELTLGSLASQMDIPVHHLSQVINELFNSNFSALINGYRIREAQMRLMHDTDTRGLILNIALSVGFNSQSVFYTAFKKITGITPTAFRNKHHHH